MEKSDKEWIDNLTKKDPIEEIDDKHYLELCRLAKIGKNVIEYMKKYSDSSSLEYLEYFQNMVDDLDSIISGESVMKNGKLCRADK